jgi:hypothetical protein
MGIPLNGGWPDFDSGGRTLLQREFPTPTSLAFWLPELIGVCFFTGGLDGIDPWGLPQEKSSFHAV